LKLSHPKFLAANPTAALRSLPVLLLLCLGLKTLPAWWQQRQTLGTLDEGFQSLAVRSPLPELKVRTEYHLAESVSAFSGKRPVKQLVRVKNGSAFARRAPVLFTQRIPSHTLWHAGRAYDLPPASAPLALDWNGQPQVSFDRDHGATRQQGRYDFSDVADLCPVLTAWRDGDGGVIQLSLQVDVPASGETLVDPVFDVANSLNYNVQLGGSAASDQAGRAAAVGDLNNDGVADLVFSVPGTDFNTRSGSGSVYVIYGGALTFTAGTGQLRDLATAGLWNVRFDGAAAGQALGTSLAIADVNGDGFKDLAIGDQLTANGSVYVIYGGAAAFPAGTGQTRDLATTTNWNVRFDAAAAADDLGTHLEAGDLSGDGVADLVMAATATDFNTRSSSGSVYVVYGGAAQFPAGTGLVKGLGTTSNFNVRFDGMNANDSLADSLALGDLNGDGKPDLAMGCEALAAGGGAVFVAYGNTALFSAGTGQLRDLTLAGSFNVRFDGVVGSALGEGVAIGDFNGDGTADLGMGAGLLNNNGFTGNGAAYAVYGGALSFTAATGQTRGLGNPGNFNVRIDGEGNNLKLGYGPGLAAAVDQVAGADLVLGSNSGTLSTNGGAWLLRGGGPLFPAGTGNLRDLGAWQGERHRFDGAAANDQLSRGLAAGDLNFDGVPDLVVGATGRLFSARSGAGAVYVIYGGGTGVLNYTETVSPTNSPSPSPSPSPTPSPTVGVSFDASSSGQPTASVPNFAYNHTVGSGGNRLLVVALTLNPPGSAGSAVSYNGLALTLLAGFNNGSVIRSEIWTLKNPPSGNFPISVTLTAAAKFLVHAASYSGVDQVTPLGAAVQSSQTASVPSVTVIKSSATSLVFAHAAVQGLPVLTSDSVPQADRGVLAWTGSGGAATTKCTGGIADEGGAAGSMSLGWTLGAAAASAQQAVEIFAYVQPNTPTNTPTWTASPVVSPTPSPSLTPTCPAGQGLAWSSPGNYPLAVMGAAGAYNGSEAMVWGGYDGTSYRNQGYGWNGSVWSAMGTSGAPAPRYGHGAVWTGTRFVVWGGSNGGVFNTGGRYNPADGTWLPTTTLGAPTGRAWHAMAYAAGQAYVIGGDPGAGPTVQCYAYNPVTDSWGSIASLAQAREQHCAVGFNSKVYVFGGLDPVSAVINTWTAFDTTAGTWSTAQAMPFARREMAAAVFNGKIYVAGGNSNAASTAEVWSFDPSGSTWTQETSLPAALSGAVLMGGPKLWIGTGNTGGGGVSVFYQADLACLGSPTPSPTASPSPTSTPTPLPGPCGSGTYYMGFSGSGTNAQNLFAATVGASLFEMPEDGSLQSLNVKINSTLGGQARLAVYTRAGAAPGTLLYETAAFNTSIGWNKVPVPGFALPKGDYYLAVQTANAAIFVEYDATFGVGYSGTLVFGPYPSTFPSGSADTKNWSVFAEFCPDYNWIGHRAGGGRPVARFLDVASQKAALRFTAPAAKTTSRVYFRANTVTASPLYRVGLQADSGGLPSGTWLASNTLVPVVGWNSVTVAVPLTAGSVYHLVIQYESGTIGPSNRISVNAGTVPRWRSMPDTEKVDPALEFQTLNAGAWNNDDSMPVFMVENADLSVFGQPYFNSIGNRVHGNGTAAPANTDDRVHSQIVRLTYTAQVDSVAAWVLSPNPAAGAPLNFAVTNLAQSVTYTSGVLVPNGSFLGLTRWAQANISPITLAAATDYRVIFYCPSIAVASAYQVLAVFTDNTQTQAMNLSWGGQNSRDQYSSNNGAAWSSFPEEDSGIRFRVTGSGPSPTPTVSPTPSASPTPSGPCDPRLDVSFGSAGRVLLNGTSPVGDDYPSRAAVDSLGRIVVAGAIRDSSFNYDVCAWRFLNDGSIDNSFGSAGVYSSGTGLDNEEFKDVVVASSGNIWLAGHSADAFDSPNYSLLGLDNSGNVIGGFSLDPTIGQEEVLMGVTEGPSGNLFMTGYERSGSLRMGLLKADAAGNFVWRATHDNAAGGNGDDAGNAVVELPSGKILVAGYSMGAGGYSQATLWRFDSAGALDTSFGNLGVVCQSEAVDSEGLSIAVDPATQNIYMIGRRGASSQMAVWKFNSFGAAVTGWASSGRFLHSGGAAQAQGLQGRLQADGKLMVAGLQMGGSAVLWRLTTAGTLDTSFGPGWFVMDGHPGSGWAASLMADPLAAGKWILAGGSTGTDADVALWKVEDPCAAATTPTPSPSATGTFTPTVTATFTPTATATFTPTATATFTPTVTATFTPTATPTFTPTATATFTPTITETSTFTLSGTPTYSATASPTWSVSPTLTPDLGCTLYLDATSGVNGATAGFSFTHTTGAGLNQGILVVMLIGSSNLDSVSGVTYNGVALTKVRSDGDPGNYDLYETWMLLNPPAGAHSVQVNRTLTAAMHAAAMTFGGVDTVAPFGYQGLQFLGAGTALNFTVPTQKDNSIILSHFAAGGGAGAITPGGGQVLAFADNTNFITRCDYKATAGLGDYGLGYSSASSSNLSAQVLELRAGPCVAWSPTATRSITPSRTITPSATPTSTSTPTGTDSPTRSATPTNSATPTHTPTSTPTPTATPQACGALFDAVASFNSSAATPSFTVAVAGGFDRLLVAQIVIASNTDSVSAVTYDGAALTRVVFNTFGNQRLETWVLAGPNTGSHSLQVSRGGGQPMHVYASSWVGMRQALPVGATGQAGFSGVSTVAQSLAVSTDGAVLLGLVSSEGSLALPSQGPGQSLLSSNGTGFTSVISRKGPGMAGPDSLSWDYGSNGTLAAQAVELVRELCAGETTTATPTRTISPTITATYSVSSTFSATGTVTASHSITPTFSATPSITQTRTVTATGTISATHSASPTRTDSFTVSPTFSVSQTFSQTPTITATATISFTHSVSPTFSATPSITETRTVTASHSASPTISQTPTITESHTASPTSTPQACGALHQSTSFLGGISGGYSGVYAMAGGTGRLLLVQVAMQSTSEVITSVTFGGQNVPAAMATTDGANYRLWTGALANPPLGAQSLVIVKSGFGPAKAWASTFVGIDGSTPIGATAGTMAAGVTAYAQALATQHDYSLVVGFTGAQNSGMGVATLGAGQILMGGDAGVGGAATVNYKAAGLAGTQSMGYLFSSTDSPAFQALELVKELCAGETITITPTFSVSPSQSPSFSPSPSVTQTFSVSPTRSASPTASPAVSPTQTPTITLTSTAVPTRLDLEAWNPGQASNEAAFAFRVTNWGAAAVALNRITVKVWVHEGGFTAGQWSATSFGGGQEIRDAADGFVANVSTAPVPVVSAFGPSDCGGSRQASVQVAASIPSAQTIPGGGGYLRTASDTNNLFKLNHSFSAMSQSLFYTKPIGWGTTYATRVQDIHMAVYLDGALQCEWSAPAVQDASGGQEPCGVSGCPALTATSTASPSASATPSATPSITQTSTATLSATESPSATPSGTPSVTITFTATPSATETSTETPSRTQSSTVTPSITETSTATPSETPSITVTFTATPSATATSTATPSITQSSTVTPSITETSTATPSQTPSITVTFTATPSATGSSTETPSITETSTATPSETPSITVTFTATPSATDTSTATPSITQSSTVTPSITESFTATSSETPSITVTYTITPSATGSFTATPSITETPSVTASETPSITVTSSATPSASETSTATPSITQSSTVTPSATESFSATASETASITVTFTATPSATETSTETPSRTQSSTVTPSVTESSTATPSETPSITVSFTVTPSATGTSTETPSITETPSATASETPSITFTFSVTPSATETSTATPSRTQSSTVTPSATESATATSSETPSITVTFTATLSATESSTVTPSRTPSSTLTPSATESATATASETPSVTVTFSATPSATESSTVTPSRTPSATQTVTATPSSSATLTATPSITATITPSATPSSSATLTVTPSITATITPSATPSFSATLTATPSITATVTPSSTPSSSATLTATPTITATITPSSTPSFSATLTDTPSITVTITPSSTPSFSATLTATPSITVTITPSATASFSATLTATPSITVTITPSATASFSATLTVTRTVTETLSPSVTRTQTPLPSPSQSPVDTFTPTPTPSGTAFLSPTSSATITPTFSVTQTWTVSATPLPTGTPETPAVLDQNIFRPGSGQPLRIGIKAPEDGRVTVHVFNLAGEKVRSPFEADVPAGQTVEALWDGRNEYGESCGSGVYVVSIRGAGIRQRLKVILMQ
jgi:uncharacterized delta-60 repeat protein